LLHRQWRSVSDPFIGGNKYTWYSTAVDVEFITWQHKQCSLVCMFQKNMSMAWVQFTGTTNRWGQITLILWIKLMGNITNGFKVLNSSDTK